MPEEQKDLRVWETVSKETILNHSKFLTVESHTVKLPDGQIIPNWPWITIPSASVVLARTDEGKFLCFRQTKYALEGISMAAPGGMLEPDEAPLDAAKRELLEETGYVASEWINLGSFVVDPNRGVATMHLFLALNAAHEAEPTKDDLEEQELLFLDRSQLENALEAGELQALAWSALVAMSLNYLDKL